LAFRLFYFARALPSCVQHHVSNFIGGLDFLQSTMCCISPSLVHKQTTAVTCNHVPINLISCRCCFDIYIFSASFSAFWCQMMSMFINLWHVSPNGPWLKSHNICISVRSIFTYSYFFFFDHHSFIHSCSISADNDEWRESEWAREKEKIIHLIWKVIDCCLHFLISIIKQIKSIMSTVLLIFFCCC
jgi:hypothetical protein